MFSGIITGIGVKDVTIYDKTGMCHELVNDEKIIWSDIDENI